MLCGIAGQSARGAAGSDGDEAGRLALGTPQNANFKLHSRFLPQG